jgi:two-component system, NarL family, response regulator NreC
MRSSLQLIIIDRHELVREGLKALIARQRDLTVLWAGASSAELEILDADPDVILVELGTGAAAEQVVELRERFPGSAVVALAMLLDPVALRRALAGGVRGYVLKEAAASELLDAIYAVARGERYIQPAVGAALALEASSGSEQLSARENEVLRLVAMGHTTREIAEILCIAPRTAESHRLRVVQKLGLRTRAELVRAAYAFRLVGDRVCLPTGARSRG